MNKIFKVIWSKARNCYVVVSELAKSHDDGHVRRSRSGCCRKAAVLAAFVLTTSLLAVPDWAQAESAAATNKFNPSATGAVKIENNGNTNTAQGTDAYATYDSQGNLIVGKDNEVVSIQKDPKTGNARVEARPENVVLGTRNGVGTFTHSENPKKPVSEDASYDYQKLDTEWITVKVYNPNTSTYDDKQVEVYKLTPGQYMDDEYNVRAKYPDRRYYSTDEDYNKAVEVYNNVATYYSQNQTRQSYYVSGATAVGVDNVAEGNHSTAIGNKAKVLNYVSTYYVDQYGKLTSDKDSAGYWLDENGNITSSRQGYYASDGTFIDRYYMVPRLIDSSDAVALGSDVQAEGRSAVAIGHQSNAKEYSVAIGENSNTDYNAVAIGKDDRAKYASTAIGHANNADGYYTATLGVENTAHGDYSSAIGYQNTVDALQSSGRERKAYQSHAIGSENTIKGDYNLAAGDKNSIDKISGMAVGVGNKISMDHNQGNTSPINLDKQSGDYSIAVGLGNKSEKNALVIGKYSSALHDGSIAIGNSVNAQSNNNNGATDSIAIGTGSQAMTKDSIAFGHEAKIGNNNSQGINGAIAIGKGANAENGQSLAIGYDAHTGNNSDVATNQNGSIIAIGTNAQAMAGYDIAIGAKASTASNSGGSAVAIGYNAVVNNGAQRSIAMGANASVALNVQDAVALGSQAYADRGANNQGGYDPASNNKNHNAGSDPVWNSTLAAVSVGSSKHDVWDGSKNVHYDQQTRQITNVAAGKEDTDAVNVAQLKQVVNLVNNSGGGSGTGGSGVHDYSVKSVNPGTDTNYNNGGASGDNALAAGVSASATGAHSVAVGNNAQAIGQDSIALGTNAKADGIGATAIGQYNTALGQNSLAFGGGYNKDQKGNTASGVASVAFGEGTQAIAEGTLAFGQNTQAGVITTDDKGNIQIGGQDAVAFGRGTKALGGRSLAFGEDTVADFNDSVAFGAGTKALSTGSTAFGSRTRALAQYSTALGNSTVAAGTYSVAFGTDTVAGAVLDNHGAFQLKNGTKMDQHGNTAYTDNQGNTYSVTYTVPDGEKHSYVVLKGQDGKTYIRDYRGNIRTATISNDGAVTVGDIVKGATEDNTLVKAKPGSNGYDLISNSNATAWGESSSASGEASTAFGIGSKAEGKNSLAALGGLAANDNSIAIGQGTKANNADKAVSAAIGQNAEASGERSLAIGFGVSEKVNGQDDTTLTSTKATGESAIAIGTDVVAQGQHSVAMGSHTDAAKDSSVAIGFDTHTVSDSAVAIGSGTRAEGRYSVALGLSSVAGKETNDATNPLNGGGSVAIGYGTSAKASRSVAIGTGATAADAEFTTALGDSANAQQRGSVAIGAGSVATRAAGNKEGGTEYKEAYLIPDVSKATDVEKATWTSTEGAVSVGGTETKFLTRQITNVAAGSLDTDAVNVAQLKQVQTKHTKVTVEGGTDAGTTAKDGTRTYTGTNLKLNQLTDQNGATVYDLKLADTVTIGGKDGADGTNGVDGHIGVRGKDGEKGVNGRDAVSIDGKDGNEGHIGLKGKDGQNAYSDITTHFGPATLNPDKNVKIIKDDVETDAATRLHYVDQNNKEHEVATMDDGQKYAGDVQASDAKANAFSRKLNEQTNVVGGVTKLDNLSTGNNVGVVSNGTDTLTIRLAKKLTDLTSVTTVTTDDKGNKTSETVQDGNGITITPSTLGAGKTAVSLTDKGLSNGGNQITHVDSGLKDAAGNKVELQDATGDVLNNAVNVGDLKKVQNVASAHTAVTVNGSVEAPEAGANGALGNYTDEKKGNLLLAQKKDSTGKITYDLKLNDKVTLGKAGTNGKDGIDGSVGLKGADGKSSIGLNGKDGISVIGKDGKNGVSITGSNGLNGKDGIDGKIAIGTPGKDGQPGKDAVSISGQNGEGHIGLTGPAGKDGKDASADIHVKNGQVGVDGTDGHSGKDGMDRVVYEDHNGVTHEVATMDDGQKYAGDFGDGASVKLNKTVTIKGKVKADAKEDDFVDGNIAVVANKKGEDGELLIKLNKDLTGLNSATYTTSTKNGDVTTTSTTVVDGTGLKIENGPSITNTGIDGGSKKITNVADGEISATSKDAVNGSQLNDVKNLAEQHTTVEAGPSGNVTVTPETNADGSKKYTVDLAKDVTFGDTAKGDKTVAISGTDGMITAGTGDNKVTVDGSKGQIVAGGNNGVKIGNIENGDSSLTIYDKDSKATGKTDKAGKYVTNLDNKTWKDDGSYVSGRAATEDQLHQVESNVNKQIADVNTKIDKVDKHHTEVTVNGGTAAKADGSYTDGNLQIAQKTGSDGQKIYDLKLSDNLNIGGAGKDGKDGQNGHMGINGADGKSGIGIDGEDGISIKGKDGKDGVTIKGIDGKNGTEGHIGLTGSAGKDGQNASADIHVKNGQVGVDGTDGHGGKDGMDRVVYEDHNHVTHEVATMDDGMKYSGDSGKAAVKLNKNVQVYGGATEYADGNNIGVVASQDGDNAKLQVKLAKDLKGINSIEAKTITTGDTTMDNSGLTVKGDGNHKDITIHQGNVNMGGNKVSGVADGKVSQDSTDAVNGSQLWQRDQAINGLSGSVNKLGNRINRVGAGAAALAALHPLDFDPDDKWDFAAGYGNYRGANAAAVGAYYRPNEDTMFSVGGSFGGGENMVNAGVSIKLGQGNHVSTSRVAMAKEMKAMRQHMAEQDALIAKLQSMHGMAVDPAKSTLFPDVAENHWAYQYVTTLAKKGILEGYPDGEFKGDRMMTRYEFAAIVYRIVESGVGSTDPELSKLVKEFSPELQYIRIDTIQKDRNGKPTIERVRVIFDAK